MTAAAPLSIPHAARTPLLCESCGYPLAGLDADGACPECGHSLESSLPSRRQGTPTQRRHTWSAWVETVTAVLNSPSEVLRRAAIETHRARGLLFTSTFVASALATTSLGAVAATVGLRGFRHFDLVGALVTVALFLLGAWVMTITASWIESVGIRFFAARRGWRVTRQVALVVIAHAAAGWVAGGVIVAVGAVLALVAGLVGGTEDAVIVIAFGGLVMGGVVGLFWFEILVYVGVRACRFANPPDAQLPEPPPQPDESAPVSHPGIASGNPVLGPGAYDADASA